VIDFMSDLFRHGQRLDKVFFLRLRQHACWAVVLFGVLAPGVAAADRGVPSPGPASPPAAVSSQTVRVRFASQGSYCVRVAVAGVTTRNAPSGGHSTTGGPIQLPADVTPSSIQWAGLYWTILADEPPTNAVNLNGELVTPVALPVGPSPCWKEANTYAYIADVTGIATPGTNIVAGLDDSGELGVAPESEGASLVVVYASEDNEAREIIVMDGNDVVASCGAQFDNAIPVTSVDGLSANLYFIGADGQTGPEYPFADDNQLWNGAALGDGDDFDASDPASPGAAPGVGWDSDAQPSGWSVVTGGGNTASVNTLCTSGGDCVAWVATVIEVGVRPCGSSNATDRATWGRVKGLFR
jgi:hypothetical protein